MEFPKEIQLCRHCGEAAFKDILDIYGHVQNCGMYKDGKCSIDEKLCFVVVYEKTSQASGIKISMQGTEIKHRLAKKCEENPDYQDGVRDTLDILLEDDDWYDAQKTYPKQSGKYLVYEEHFDIPYYGIFCFNTGEGERSGWEYSGKKFLKNMIGWAELHKPVFEEESQETNTSEKLKLIQEYEDICFEGFEGTFEDYIEYKRSYGKKDE